MKISVGEIEGGKEESSLVSVGGYFIWLNTLGSVAFWKNTQANGIKVQPELASSNATVNFQQIRRSLSVSLWLVELFKDIITARLQFFFLWKPPKFSRCPPQTEAVAAQPKNSLDSELLTYILGSVTFKPNYPSLQEINLRPSNTWQKESL